MADKGGGGAAAAYGTSAGLDLVSGVMGYLSAQSAERMANTRTDMIRMSTAMQAQRYREQADQFKAQQEVMYLGSGVKVAGSVIDVLDHTARIAQENIDSIQMRGEIEAADELNKGREARIAGDNALAGGIISAYGMGLKAATMMG